MSLYVYIKQCQIILFLLLFHPNEYNSDIDRNVERIIGGKLAKIKDHPYIVSIILKSDFRSTSVAFRGAAVIISKYWAVTAAHCISQFEKTIWKTGLVYLRGNTATWKRHKHNRDHRIIKRYGHSRYAIMTENDCDIAIVKVEQPFQGKYEKPIKVASKHFKANMKTPATVAGWGTKVASFSECERDLRSVSIFVTPQDTCVKAYEKHPKLAVTKKMICGGISKGGKDACNGDSGGPLVQSAVLIGIVSYGHKCGLAKYPGVYTRVSAFQDWFISMENQLGVKLGIKYADAPHK